MRQLSIYERLYIKLQQMEKKFQGFSVFLLFKFKFLFLKIIILYDIRFVPKTIFTYIPYILIYKRSNKKGANVSNFHILYIGKLHTIIV